MVTMSVPNRIENKNIDRKRLEPRELLWQQHYGCHLIYFVMYTSAAKFEEHCFNISRDILYLVFYDSSCNSYDVINFLICIIQNLSILDRKR